VLGAASLVVSVVALVVAGFSVYVVSLRHANIVVDITAAEISHVRLAGAVPELAFLTGTLLVSNDGARGGLVARVQIAKLDDHVGLWAAPHPIDVPWSLFPVVLQANEVQTFRWVYQLQTMGDLTGDDGMERVVRRIERLSAITLVVEWSYHRSAGLPFATRWLPDRLRRTRKLVEEQLEYAIDSRGYRSDVGRALREVNQPDMADRVAPSISAET
jgi:hypothetical protein